MGLSNYPCAAEGVIPLIVMNTVMSVALLKNMFRSVLQAVGATPSSSTTDTYNYYPSSYTSLFQDTTTTSTCASSSSRPRRVSITHYKSLCRNNNNNNKSVMVECCVCLTRFEANQEVSELPCKHFFHTSCLDKWFDNRHPTCPLCRSFS
ncbi:hypothetical protein PIB30_071956 [Stylosanthes scabra]|uniref:RING-type domain-containing protein n=1 Tax=Stylosanthes scabra TaxID=79078 RepID=A0ABU6WPX7_9FABA|nr:hypothetical protein [Stylosanthes scabra]